MYTEEDKKLALNGATFAVQAAVVKKRYDHFLSKYGQKRTAELLQFDKMSMTLKLTEKGKDYFSCPPVVNFGNEDIKLSTVSIEKLKLLYDSKVLNEFQFKSWLHFIKSKSSQKQNPTPLFLDTYIGDDDMTKVVVGNAAFKNYLEFPKLRAASDKPGLTDVPPCKYLGNLYKFSLTKAYCEYMEVSYNDCENNRSCDNCYLPLTQQIGEVFVGSLDREYRRDVKIIKKYSDELETIVKNKLN